MDPKRRVEFYWAEETDSNFLEFQKQMKEIQKKCVPEIVTAVCLKSLTKSKAEHRQRKTPQDLLGALKDEQKFYR